MAINTCVVSGSVKSLLNQGVNSVTIKAYCDRPFFHTDGTQILNYEVSTTSDANGNWSLTLIETTTPSNPNTSPATTGIPLSFSFEYSTGGSGLYVRKEYTAIIPNQASATFASLVPNQV